MSAAAWVCDSCDTNNFAQARVCRVCHRPPGSATGTVRPVPTSVLLVQQDQRPTFVESKHSAQSRPGPGPEPAKITMLASAARTPTPAPPPPPKRRIWPAFAWLAAAGVVLAVVLNLHLVIGSQAPARSGSAGAGTGGSGTDQALASTPVPCPAAAAQWLPGGGTGAVLVAAYTTDKHIVTICRDISGQLYYDGQVRGAATDSDNHISLPATAASNGFIAVNKTYRYEIDGSELVVTNAGKELSRRALTRTGP